MEPFWWLGSEILPYYLFKLVSLYVTVYVDLDNY